ARRPIPTVLDADALTLFQGPAERPVVLTPHLGEFRAQFGDQLADAAANDRWGAASKAAQKIKGTVLLKGVPTVIADLRGPIHVVASGNPGLATGGSGDLLAGFIGAFLARGSPGPAAAALGAHVLGRAAAHGGPQRTARRPAHGGRPAGRAVSSGSSPVGPVAASPRSASAATAHGRTIYDRQARTWRLPVTSRAGYPAARVRVALADGVADAVWLGTADG